MASHGPHKHSSSSHSKHGSRHDGKSSKSKHHEKAASSSGRGRSAGGGREVDFLFVVNELNIDQNRERFADIWGNNIPPKNYMYYDPETIGQVFRFHNGTVTKELAYFWHRPSRMLPGVIAYDDIIPPGSSIPFIRELETYSTFTIFSCGPFLPFVVGCGDVQVPDDPDFLSWQALHFHHQDGVSQASPSGGQKIVAGQNASFIESLLPKSYNNNDRHAPPSAGLGGHVALVIGLMALSQDRGTIDNAFERQHWNNDQWTGRRDRGAWPTVLQDPRGVLVNISRDLSGQPGTSVDEIRDFEWGSIAVRG